jgi:hypothetical protein
VSKPFGLPAKDAAAPPAKEVPPLAARGGSVTRANALSHECNRTPLCIVILARSDPILWQGAGANKAVMGVVDKLGIECTVTESFRPQQGRLRIPQTKQ